MRINKKCFARALINMFILTYRGCLGSSKQQSPEYKTAPNTYKIVIYHIFKIFLCGKWFKI